MVLSIRGVYPHGCTANGELQMGATASHHERGSYQLHLALPGKDPNSKFKVQFLLNAYRYHTILNLKIVKLNYCESGICVLSAY